jgi:hypothetical protein
MTGSGQSDKERKTCRGSLARIEHPPAKRKNRGSNPLLGTYLYPMVYPTYLNYGILWEYHKPYIGRGIL